MKVCVHDGTESYETEADDCGTKPYIAIKKCRMLRSDIQLYTRDEVPEQLLNELPEEKRNQKVFRVYRRPEAVVKHLKDFNYIPLANNHPDVDITPDNRKESPKMKHNDSHKYESIHQVIHNLCIVTD